MRDTEKQSQQQEWKQLTYCQHGKAGYCYTCDKYKPCPKCGMKNCKKGCKHRIHTPCQKCLDQGKAKKPPITDEETLRLGVRFQETINLTEEEKLLLKKGKLPEGRISERRSERSDAPEPSSQPEEEPQTAPEIGRAHV